MKAQEIILLLLFATLAYSEECPLECPVCMQLCLKTTCFTSGDCTKCIFTQNCTDVYCKMKVGCFEKCPPGSLGIRFNNNSSMYHYYIVTTNCCNNETKVTSIFFLIHLLLS